MRLGKPIPQDLARTILLLHELYSLNPNSVAERISPSEILAKQGDYNPLLNTAHLFDGEQNVTAARIQINDDVYVVEQRGEEITDWHVYKDTIQARIIKPSGINMNELLSPVQEEEVIYI